jgi:8-oxo-dGTP pyrophosphatase MutT (NUDIX family)
MNLNDALRDPFVAVVQTLLDELNPDYPAQAAQMAAVVLMLRLREPETPEVLLIKRAEFEGDPWSGHVALPGGRHESGDRTLVETAVRETREEIAVDVAAVGRMLGVLEDVTPLTRRLPPITIRPFVAVVPANLELELSSEVAAAFWIPLESLRNPGTRSSSRVIAGDRHLDVQGYTLGEHFVWGLTERILTDFLSRLERA